MENLTGKPSPPAASPPRTPRRLTPAVIAAGCRWLKRVDPVLAQAIRRFGPCRLVIEPMPSPFAALLEGIVYQQLHATAAATIFGRIRTCLAPDRPLRPDDILRATDATLRGCGLSGAKTAAIRDLAEKTAAGLVPDAETLATLADDEIIDRLTAVRGIGRWTAEMLLIFRLFHPERLPTPRELATHGERWRPYRTIACWYLWRVSEAAGKRSRD